MQLRKGGFSSGHAGPYREKPQQHFFPHTGAAGKSLWPAPGSRPR